MRFCRCWLVDWNRGGLTSIEVSVVEPFRDSFWNIPPILENGMYLAAVLTLAVFVYGVYRRIRLWRLGAEGHELDRVSECLRRLLVHSVVQARLFTEHRAGVMHMAIFVASILLFIGTALATIDYDVGVRLMGVRLLRSTGYLVYELVLDLAGVLFLIGLAIAFYQRFIKKLSRFGGGWRFGFILVLLILINVTGFMVEGLRLAATQPSWAHWSPVGNAFAVLVRTLGAGEQTIRALHSLTWLIHGGSALLLVAFVPYGRLLHLVTSPLNVFFSSMGPKGALPFIHDLEGVPSIVAGRITEFTKSQLLSLDACTECGRCEATCPAWEAGQPLSPRRIVLDLRDHLSLSGQCFTGGRTTRSGVQQRVQANVNLVGPVVGPESIWACMTCYACPDACPVLINPMILIIEMRRRLVERGEIPSVMAESLEQTLLLGSPWGQARSERTAWMRDLQVRILEPGEQVEFLYWVGDTSAFDLEAQAIPRALVQVLHRAGIDFGILGTEERSDGEAVRRLGEEGLFHVMARQNIEVLSKYRFTKILTHCPHTYNTFKSEYPELGGEFQVVHHSQLLRDLMERGVLRPTQPINERVTYHDPCYLGRYHQVFDKPRRLLESLPGLELAEMERNRENALCCGAGGGLAWVDVANGRRVNYVRFQEAEATRTRTLATACPFCKMMLLDAARHKRSEYKIKVKDIAELVLESRPEGVS